MTSIKIGTILIAKEDRFMSKNYGETFKPWVIKGNSYKIIRYRSHEDDYMIIDEQGDEHFIGMDYINHLFTIKRYTLTDLKEKKIAVKLRNEEEFKKVLNILDVRKSSQFYENEKYYGIDDDGDFYYLLNNELEGRTLVPSIDLIDLEEKEETKEVINEAFYIQKLESEINRLKWELDKWKDEAALWNTRYHHVLSNLTDKTNELNKLRESPQISQDLEKRERMAWELVVHSNIQYEKAFEMVKDFLAKSKEEGK